LSREKAGAFSRLFFFDAEWRVPGPLHQRIRVVLGLVFTLAVLHLLSNRLLASAVLLIGWTLLFFPLRGGELLAFVLAALFFLGQNYVCLKAGLFAFRFKDVLLMPWYEPLLWGFYYLTMERFVSGSRPTGAVVDIKSIAGLAATSMVFSLFSYDSHVLLAATICSTVFLFVLFHTRMDVYYAAYALTLGFIVELFGVSTGLWSYPAPDVLGIPYWFATMWISVGLLGCRFLFPAADWLAVRVGGQRE
jgi:hypothetical protein